MTLERSRSPRLGRADYGGTCWWCGNPANSREHRFKRSDLVTQFGTGSYLESGGVVRGREGRLQEVQGPNAKAVKFAPSLCEACNTARSQPSDRAYEQFIAYVVASEDAILRSSAIDLRDVYGRDWRGGAIDFTRYIAKHAGCRLAEAGVAVPADLRFFLSGASALPGFRVGFEIREDILAMGAGDQGLWLGDLQYLADDAGGITWVGSFYGFRWLRIVWEHSYDLPAWRAARRRLALRRDWNIEPSTIAARAAERAGEADDSGRTNEVESPSRLR